MKQFNRTEIVTSIVNRRRSAALLGAAIMIGAASLSLETSSAFAASAIPADQAKVVVANSQNADVDHGYLGVQIQPVTQEVADAIDLANPAGALVANVSKDSPAARAGIKQGDAITSVGEKPVSTPKDLSRLVADLTPGDKKTVTVWRFGKSVDLTVEIGSSDDGMAKLAASKGSEQAIPAGPRIGVALVDLTPEVRERLDLSQDVQGAVVANVSPDKPAAAAGLKAGDVILSVNDKTIQNASGAKNAVADVAKAKKKSVLLLIQRGNNTTFVAVPFTTA